jgi:Na+/H+ antiporter NhaD/arsenite permease-like protein
VQGTAQHATDWVPTELRHHLSEIAEILFFLMGAMVIVELIDAHRGFSVVTERISTRKQSTLLWLIGLLTFFLSAALDNLTTTIVMISLLRKLIAQQQQRWVYAGVVVIAANAGGAWSPIGDVTTTMLWIGNQITTLGIVKQLILPSLVCLLVPLLWLSLRLKGEVERALLFVPVFKTVTHLPPYMGILFGLGVLWVVTELMHHGKDDEQRHPLTVAGVLRRIDTPSILFFLGILLAVSALSTAGHLTAVAGWLRDSLGNVYAINVAIGLLSAVVDNVPLVAGAMKMYPLLPAEAVTGPQADWLQHFVQDGTFWEMLAYCAGTGGSCLIIGSAAGVAAMGMEKISFGWYLRHISGLALMGYLAGAGVYIVLHTLG